MDRNSYCTHVILTDLTVFCLFALALDAVIHTCLTITNKIVHKNKWLRSTNWNCIFVRLANTEMLCCTYNTKHSSQLFDIKLMWQHQQILRKFGVQIANIRHATKHTVMLRCRWLQNTFFSVSVKHLCLCYAVHLCVWYFVLRLTLCETLWRNICSRYHIWDFTYTEWEQEKQPHKGLQQL